MNVIFCDQWEVAQTECLEQLAHQGSFILGILPTPGAALDFHKLAKLRFRDFIQVDKELSILEFD